MDDDITIRTEDIDDFLNESFMVLDEVEEFREKMGSYSKNRSTEKSSTDEVIVIEDEENKSHASVSESLEDGEIPEEEGEGAHQVHPFLCLIDSYQLNEDQKTVQQLQSRKSLKDSAFHMVSTHGDLMKLLNSLRKATEISLNLHCTECPNIYLPLMTISTPEKDYIIDSKKMRHDMLLLTEIFINPKIVKILYDAENVLSYLQNRMHLFLVNIFDVKEAGKVLKTEHTSLNSILKQKYSCDVEEHLGNVDLRLRPLDLNTKTFCTAAAHYLIDIYHEYKNELLGRDEDLYNELMKKFRETSKIMFPLNQECPLEPLVAELKNRQNCELDVLKKLYAWRNTVAQKLNKNPEYVLKRGHIINLASNLFEFNPMISTISKNTAANQYSNNIAEIVSTSKTEFRIAIPSLKQQKQQYVYFLLEELDRVDSIAKRKLDGKFKNQNMIKLSKIEEKVKINPPPSPPKIKPIEKPNNAVNKKVGHAKNLQNNLLRSNPPLKSPNKNTNKNTKTANKFVPTFANGANSVSFSPPSIQHYSNFSQKPNPWTPNQNNSNSSISYLPPSNQSSFVNNRVGQFMVAPNQNPPFPNNANISGQFMATSSQNSTYYGAVTSNQKSSCSISQIPSLFDSVNTSANSNATQFNSGNTNATQFNSASTSATQFNCASTNATQFKPPYSQNNSNSLPFSLRPTPFFTNSNNNSKDMDVGGYNDNNDGNRRRKSRFDVSSQNVMSPNLPRPFVPVLYPANATVTSNNGVYKLPNFTAPQVNTFPRFTAPRNNFGVEAQNEMSKKEFSKPNNKSLRGNFGANMEFEQSLTDIDKKINSLERNVNEKFQSRKWDRKRRY